MAQAYNHIILPLANQRDKRTQVLWGVADFRHRFGRQPEGMWLPETAVDTESLEALAEQGIAYTILAPRQAKRVRKPGGDWQDVNESSIDTTRPYKVLLPSGRGMALFFYNGGLSRAVAFERVLADGNEFAARLIEAAGQETGEPRLAHIATDGETYGHHHRFADMALAFALEQIELQPDVRLTNYGELLSLHPATDEVQIVERSSWSCEHGVERWRSDCGCNMGDHPGWNQAWRAPLRRAMDWLRDELAERFELEAAGLLSDPWAARDAYISLVLDRSEASVERFFTAQAQVSLTKAQRHTALSLLEMQRQAMLMFASCAWFFDDIAGIESRQGLLHACRAIDLLNDITPDNGIEDRFLELLGPAKSNRIEEGDGASIYRRHVQSVRFDLLRLAAHYAVSAAFRDYEDEDKVGAYLVRKRDFRVEESGRTKLVLGRVEAVSTVTQEWGEFYFGVVHLGDQNLSGSVTAYTDEAAYQAFCDSALAVFSWGDLPGVIRLFSHHVAGQPLSFASLFRDEQRRILRLITEPVLAEAEDAYRRVYQDHTPLIRYLASLWQPLPHRLQWATQLDLDLELSRALTETPIDPERVKAVLEEQRLAGTQFDTETQARDLAATLKRLADAWAASPQDAEALDNLEKAVTLLPLLPFKVDLSQTQNVFYSTASELLTTGVAAELEQRLVALGKALYVRLTPADES